ncbi:MAG: hypothetical protein QM783_07095 [Phycisphaerales bacterium]
MRSIVMSLALAGLAGTASAQLAGVNGIHVVYGNGFNGWTSTTNTTNNGLAGFRIQENISPTTDHSDGDFANRNFGFLSADAGATTYSYDGTSSFSITYRHRMAVSNSPVLPNGGASTEGGLTFLQGGEGHPYEDGGIFSLYNGTSWVGGMGANFSILAQSDPNNPQSITNPGLTVGGWATYRFDYWAPGALGPGSLASYQASVLDETTGNFRISSLTSWDQGSSWPGGLLAGTAIGFRMQNVPVLGLDNNFDAQYSNIVIGAVVPTPASAGALALVGLAGFRRRR